MTLKSPIRYFGGKGGMLSLLLSRFPQAGLYDTFVDAYGGAGTVLLSKPPCPIEIYNDLDANVYSLFKTLADPVAFAEFRRLAELALYDEQTSTEFRASLRTEVLTPTRRAFLFWYVNRTRHNGIGGFSINTTVRRRMSKSTSDFLSSVEALPALHQRLSSVIVCCQDALELIGQYDRGRCLIYLDPPYVQSTRGDTRYAVDADDAHHQQLIAALKRIDYAYVVLSGYDNPLYDGLDGFEKHQFQVNVTDGTGAPKTKMETLWTNFTLERMPLFAQQVSP